MIFLDIYESFELMIFYINNIISIIKLKNNPHVEYSCEMKVIVACFIIDLWKLSKLKKDVVEIARVPPLRNAIMN